MYAFLFGPSPCVLHALSFSQSLIANILCRLQYDMVDCPVPYPYSFKYAHPSLFADWYLAVSRIRGFAPVVKIHHSDPSLGRRIKIIGELEQVFEPCRMMLKGLGCGRSTSHHNVSAKKIKTLKVGQLFAGFHFSWEVLEPNRSEKRGMGAFSSAFFLTERISTFFL